MEDKRLLRLVKKARFGDKDAFCELIEVKGRKIVYIASNLMGNNSDGEDAAQEAVITLARKIGTLKKAELFDAWMYRIIYNVCMDEKRRKARKLDASGELDVAIATVAEQSPELIPEKKMEEAADKEAVMAAINELPERYRMCLILYYYEEMSYGEIAQTLQVSDQVVANTLNRAKEKLRISLSGERFVQPGSVDAASFSEGISGEPRLPDIAVKAGAFLPAALISQSIAMNEAATVMPSAVASISGVAAAVAMPKGLILTRFADSVLAKSAAGAACAAALAAGLAMGFPPQSTPQAIPEPEPIVEQKQTPVEEPQEVVRTAKVEGLPEGSKTTILTEGVDDAALQAFKANLGNYTHVTDLTNDGYYYSVYRDNNDETIYVLTIEKVDG